MADEEQQGKVLYEAAAAVSDSEGDSGGESFNNTTRFRSSELNLTIVTNEENGAPEPREPQFTRASSFDRPPTPHSPYEDTVSDDGSLASEVEAEEEYGHAVERSHPYDNLPRKEDYIARLGPLSCGICGEEYDNEHTPTQIPDCRHMFGSHCIVQWFESNQGNSNKCPYCRVELFQSEYYSDDEEYDSDYAGEEEIINEGDDFASSGWRLRSMRSRSPERESDPLPADDDNLDSDDMEAVNQYFQEEVADEEAESELAPSSPRAPIEYGASFLLPEREAATVQKHALNESDQEEDRTGLIPKRRRTLMVNIPEIEESGLDSAFCCPSPMQSPPRQLPDPSLFSPTYQPAPPSPPRYLLGPGRFSGLGQSSRQRIPNPHERKRSNESNSSGDEIVNDNDPRPSVQQRRVQLQDREDEDASPRDEAEEDDDAEINWDSRYGGDGNQAMDIDRESSSSSEVASLDGTPEVAPGSREPIRVVLPRRSPDRCRSFWRSPSPKPQKQKSAKPAKQNIPPPQNVPTKRTTPKSPGPPPSLKDQSKPATALASLGVKYTLFSPTLSDTNEYSQGRLSQSWVVTPGIIWQGSVAAWKQLDYLTVALITTCVIVHLFKAYRIPTIKFLPLPRLAYSPTSIGEYWTHELGGRKYSTLFTAPVLHDSWPHLLGNIDKPARKGVATLYPNLPLRELDASHGFCVLRPARTLPQASNGEQRRCGTPWRCPSRSCVYPR
ncbi:hypothetical protein BDV96DRAFT_636972 [Lophiotrema nucula]|uniref:RING-type domain-containing protein n=1 Tax=Lophiotrema nucula TaxID=690887 RepID=A0A6A5YLH4_9PLEO|nr:hypothetical protein BDV96DRAFT_636972 [Lophiotrema nucula]